MVSSVGWENVGKMSCSGRVMTDPGSTGTRMRTTNVWPAYLQVQSFWQNLTFSTIQICLACQTGFLPWEVLFFLNLVQDYPLILLFKIKTVLGEFGHGDNVNHWTITIAIEQEQRAIAKEYLGNVKKWAMAIIGQEQEAAGSDVSGRASASRVAAHLLTNWPALSPVSSLGQF